VRDSKWTSGTQFGLWVLLILGLLTPLFIAVFWGNAQVDEAYQQFQQARNLAQGIAFKWDSLSPLFTALLALVARLAAAVTQDAATGLLPTAALGLGLTGWMLAIASWFLIGLTFNQPTFSATAVFLLALHPLQPHLFGLESSLVFGLFGLATLFAVRGKAIAALITLTLMVLTQPPMLGFAIPLIALARVWKGRSPSLVHIAVMMTIGSVLYTLAIALVLVVQGDTNGPGSWRVLAPLFVAAQLLIATGVARIVPDFDWLVRPLADKRTLQRSFIVLGLVVLVVWQGSALYNQWRLRPMMRRSLYSSVAEWLKTHTLPAETVGTAEEGLLGYLSNRSALALPETSSPSTLLAAIDQLRPDYCVALDNLVWHGVQLDPWFQERYQQTFQVANPYDSASPLTVLQHVPSPYDAGSIVDKQASFTADGKEWIELTGYRLEGLRVAQGKTIHLSLYWRAATQVNQALVPVVRLVDPATGAVWAKTENTAPGGLATEFWNNGSQFTDHYALAIPSDLPPGDYVVDVAIFPRQDDSMPIPAGLQGNALRRSPVELAHVFLPRDVSAAPARPDYSVDFSFGDEIELVGYDAPSQVRPGETFPIALYWHALAPIPINYKVFVHVLTADDQLLAQHDGLPINWSYPTTYWQPGEFIRDEHALTMDPSAPRGDYVLSVGIYAANSGERATVRDAAGNEDPEKRVILQPIKVR